MTRLARSSLAVTTLAFLFACHSDRTVTTPFGPPSFDISDGAHSGNPDFFFFPPLVPTPTGDLNFEPGDFNPALAPLVRVCELTANPATDASATCVDGPPILPPTPARLAPGEELYTLEWDTKAPELHQASFYRIHVFGAGSAEQLGTELGFLDVDPVDQGMKNARSTETYQFQDGRTLPIKFRIEGGALCANDVDCAERVVTDAGGDVITNTGFAAASFPPGALDLGQQVTVIIDRFTVGSDNDCHNGQLAAVQQFEGCYRFRTEPGPTDFNIPVRVEVCVELPFTEPRFPFLSLFKSDPGVTEALRNVNDELIDCAAFSGTADLIGRSPAVRLLHLASAGWRALTRFVAPKSAHATTMANVGLGGETGSFSNIGWGLVATSTSLSSSAGLAVVGESLTLTATVTPASPMTPTGVVQFFDGATLLGSAPVDAQGVATLPVRGLSLAPHTLSSSFIGSHGTPHMQPSTSGALTQHMVQRFNTLPEFTAALGGAATQSQNLDGIEGGTPISTLIAGVLNVRSTFPTLEVVSCGGTNAIAGSGGTVRQDGTGRYDLLFGAVRNALSFDVGAQDPATGPARIEVQTDAGTVTFPVSNLSGNESTPTFLGMIASIAINQVLVHEGPEVGGTGNEEICLDTFLTGSVPLP